jgi:hypothetical protein
MYDIACDAFSPIKQKYKIEKGRESAFLPLSVYRNHNSFSEFYFGQTLYENQVDIINAITSTGTQEVDIVQPRQCGKTSSVAVASAKLCETEGAEWNKTNPEPYRIGVFGPKLAQAQIDLTRIKFWASHNKEGKTLIDWANSTNSVIKWHNGCEVHAISASEQTETEGLTYNVAIIEEAQKVSDHAVSQVITPMVGATAGKIVKIGTVRAIRNHFWRSCNKNPRTIKVAHHWMLCGLLLRRGGFKEHNGNKFSNYILDRMPWMLKEKYMLSGYFPNDPDYMYYGDMEYNDFLTQYELKWLEQYGIFLSRDEIDKMFIGFHPIEYSQITAQDELYAGIDFATGDGQDDTSLSVYKKIGNLKRKIYGTTWGELPIPDQKRELVNMFGPHGRFHCKAILGDVGGNGQAVIEDLRAEVGMPIFGVHFQSTDKDIKTVSMNMKTSMFNDFKKDIQNGLVQHYGINADTPKEMQMQYHKDRREWETLESETRDDTVNKKIQATESEHDDIPCSDILAVRAMRLSGRIIGQQQVLLHKIPYAIVQSTVYR